MMTKEQLLDLISMNDSMWELVLKLGAGRDVHSFELLKQYSTLSGRVAGQLKGELLQLIDGQEVQS